MFKKLFTWLVRLILLLWFVLTIIVGMWIWQENSAPVNVSYFGFNFSDQTLGTVMTIMLLAGFGLGSVPLVLMAMVRKAAHKRQLKKARRDYEKRGYEKRDNENKIGEKPPADIKQLSAGTPKAIGENE